MKIAPYAVLLGITFVSGCTEKKLAEDKSRQEMEAKARAEAAKKEMQTLPAAFKSRYNKRLDQNPPKAGTEKPPEPTKAP